MPVRLLRKKLFFSPFKRIEAARSKATPIKKIPKIWQTKDALTNRKRAAIPPITEDVPRLLNSPLATAKRKNPEAERYTDALGILASYKALPPTTSDRPQSDPKTKSQAKGMYLAIGSSF